MREGGWPRSWRGFRHETRTRAANPQGDCPPPEGGIARVIVRPTPADPPPPWPPSAATQVPGLVVLCVPGKGTLSSTSKSTRQDGPCLDEPFTALLMTYPLESKTACDPPSGLVRRDLDTRIPHEVCSDCTTPTIGCGCVPRDRWGRGAATVEAASARPCVSLQMCWRNSHHAPVRSDLETATEHRRTPRMHLSNQAIRPPNHAPPQRRQLSSRLRGGLAPQASAARPDCRHRASIAPSSLRPLAPCASWSACTASARHAPPTQSRLHRAVLRPPAARAVRKLFLRKLSVRNASARHAPQPSAASKCMTGEQPLLPCTCTLWSRCSSGSPDQALGSRQLRRGRGGRGHDRERCAEKALPEVGAQGCVAGVGAWRRPALAPGALPPRSARRLQPTSGPCHHSTCAKPKS